MHTGRTPGADAARAWRSRDTDVARPMHTGRTTGADAAWHRRKVTCDQSVHCRPIMSSGDETDCDMLDLVYILNLSQRQRRYWVHPLWMKKGKHSGVFNVMKELNMYPERFQNFYRMSHKCFNKILLLVKDRLQKKATNWRVPISPEERLLITLRYFATGCTFKSLSYYFLKGHSTIRQIVHHTARVIWEKLQPIYMPTPTTDKWNEISQRFYELWNLPNCCGSVDGKHIRIKAPPRSGSAFINYKGYFSLVLLAVADADGRFVTIDVGEFGRNSDGRVLKNSSFGKALRERRLNLPESAALPGETQEVPYFFVGDEAFPLSEHLLRPFSRRELTNNETKIFNYRLSRARKSVECAFGMIVSKFGLLNTLVRCDPTAVDSLIQAMCVLHNAIKECDGLYSTPSYQNSIVVGSVPVELPTNNPKNVRKYLSNYFKNRTPIPHQDMYCT